MRTRVLGCASVPDAASGPSTMVESLPAESAGLPGWRFFALMPHSSLPYSSRGRGQPLVTRFSYRGIDLGGYTSARNESQAGVWKPTPH